MADPTLHVVVRAKDAISGVLRNVAREARSVGNAITTSFAKAGKASSGLLSGMGGLKRVLAGGIIGMAARQMIQFGSEAANARRELAKLNGVQDAGVVAWDRNAKMWDEFKQKLGDVAIAAVKGGQAVADMIVAPVQKETTFEEVDAKIKAAQDARAGALKAVMELGTESGGTIAEQRGALSRMFLGSKGELIGELGAATDEVQRLMDLRDEMSASNRQWFENFNRYDIDTQRPNFIRGLPMMMQGATEVPQGDVESLGFREAGAAFKDLPSAVPGASLAMQAVGMAEFAVKAAEANAVLKEQQQLTKNIADTVAGGIGGALRQLVEGEAPKVRNILRGILADIIATQAQMRISKAIIGLGFADGGVAPGGFKPIRAFADGGVVTRPTIGIVGEGGRDEAIVPLKNGGIPVRGGTGGGNTVHITVQSLDPTTAASVILRNIPAIKAGLMDAMRSDSDFRGGMKARLA